MRGEGPSTPLLHGLLPSGSNSVLGRMQVRVPAPAEAQKEAKLSHRQGGSGGLPEQARAQVARSRV